MVKLDRMVTMSSSTMWPCQIHSNSILSIEKWPGEAVEKLNCLGKTLPPCDCYEFKPDKASYFGTISKTVSGRVCQPWSFQYPHRHNKKPEKFPSSGLDKNYCRNPGDTKDFGRPWCYTSDPFVEWEYCDVPKDSFELNIFWSKFLIIRESCEIFWLMFKTLRSVNLKKKRMRRVKLRPNFYGT